MKLNDVNVTRIGNLVIMFINGKPLQKTFNNTEEVLKVFEKVQHLDRWSEDEVEELRKMMTSEKLPLEIEFEKQLKEKIEKAKENKSILDFMKEVSENGHDLFEVKSTSIYMKGINISIPEFLIKKMIDVDNDEKLNSYINFWRRCALLSDARARHDLFEHLEGGNFTITPQGYFVAYRNVSIKNEGNAELQKFVTQEFLKIKRWKKAPRNYEVYLDYNPRENKDQYLVIPSNTDGIIYDEHIGNLAELYENIAKVSETVYTDNYSRTFSIKIGELVQMDKKNCDSNPDNDCSFGLHIGNKTFLSQGSFGCTGLAVLVNPSKVIAVPKYNKNKMRVCEYLPIGVVDYVDGELVELDTSELEFEYAEHDQQELEKLVGLNSNQLEEYKRNEFIPLEMDLESLKNITVSLEEATKTIKNRVIKL